MIAQRKSKLWSAAGRNLLEELPLASWTAQDSLQLLDDLERRIADLDIAAQQEAEKNPVAQLLQTHPGVGPITGLAVAVTLGQIERFACVGFDRNSTEAGDLFDSPSENAFLKLTDAKKGTDINQGYILSTAGVTLGITAADASGFNLLPLASNSKGVLGDWNPVPGCYQFTHLQGSPQFCGNLLLDVGIDKMFLDLPSSERPAKSYDSTNRVPAGVRMNIQVGLQGQPPVMSYDFPAVQPPQPPQVAAPKYVKWVDKTTKFVNTGHRPLLNFNYLYSGQCGQVGFEPLKNGRR